MAGQELTENEPEKTEEPKVQAPQPNKTPGVTWFGVLVLCLIVSTMVSLGAVKVYHDQFAVKVVTIDMGAYQEQLTLLLARKELTRDGVTKRIQELDRRIQEDMPPGTVVLLDDVVMTNVKQYRPQN